MIFFLCLLDFMSFTFVLPVITIDSALQANMPLFSLMLFSPASEETSSKKKNNHRFHRVFQLFLARSRRILQYWVCNFGTAAAFVGVLSLFCKLLRLNCNNKQRTTFAQQNICSLSEGLRLDGRNHFSSGHFANVHDGVLCDVFCDLK